MYVQNARWLGVRIGWQQQQIDHFYCSMCWSWDRHAAMAAAATCRAAPRWLLWLQSGASGVSDGLLILPGLGPYGVCAQHGLVLVPTYTVLTRVYWRRRLGAARLL